jgi:hypothetical protein
MGRPKKPNSPPITDKPFRDALRLESELAEQGEPCTAKEGSLRWNARQLLLKGDVQTIRELADRLDGKPTQRIGGDEEGVPIQLVAAPIDFSRYNEEELLLLEKAAGLLYGPDADGASKNSRARVRRLAWLPYNAVDNGRQL